MGPRSGKRRMKRRIDPAHCAYVGRVGDKHDLGDGLWLAARGVGRTGRGRRGLQLHLQRLQQVSAQHVISKEKHAEATGGGEAHAGQASWRRAPRRKEAAVPWAQRPETRGC